LPSYDRQRLSGIRRGWCPSRPKTASGVPFRRWLCSPPVVKCAGFISPVWSSQGETALGKAYSACGIPALARPPARLHS
jgi:hypothetical protein